MTISRSDLRDTDVVDAPELLSDGSTPYGSVSITSTSGSTVNVGLYADGEGIRTGLDNPVNVGDLVTITGTSGGAADGSYVVASVISDSAFTVVGSIASSTGGTASFIYPPGARAIGLSTTGLTHVTHNTVEGAIIDLDAALLTPVGHQTLRQLIHLADEGGPFEGFASGAYQETLPAADPFPTSVIWWTDSSKVSKIVEETVTYNGNKTIATDQWKVYAVDGTTVLATVTDAITYSGVFELSRTRTIV